MKQSPTDFIYVLLPNIYDRTPRLASLLILCGEEELVAILHWINWFYWGQFWPVCNVKAFNTIKSQYIYVRYKYTKLSKLLSLDKIWDYIISSVLFHIYLVYIDQCQCASHVHTNASCTYDDLKHIKNAPTHKQAHTCIYVHMCVCISQCMYVCIYVCMYVWMDGWMDGWMDVWMDGWMHECMHACMHAYICRPV